MADLRAAMEIAERHGMVLAPDPQNPALANIRCKVCGWPGREHDALIERYVKEPHGCHPCSWERAHKTPCPGFPERAQ